MDYYEHGRWVAGPTYPMRVRSSIAFSVSAFEFLSCGGEVLEVRIITNKEPTKHTLPLLTKGLVGASRDRRD